MCRHKSVHVIQAPFYLFQTIIFTEQFRKYCLVRIIESKTPIKMEESFSKSYAELNQQWASHSSNSMQAQTLQNPKQPSDLSLQLPNLQKAKESFRKFTKQIKQFAYTPIREDIMTYCYGHKKSQKCLQTEIKPQSLVKKIEIRIQKMLKTKKLKRNWGEEDLKILIWIVSKYCDYKSIQDIDKDLTIEDWKIIASIIPGVTAEACMFKWLSIKKITLATHNWTKIQSELLSRIVKEKIEMLEGKADVKDWKEISQELYRLNEDVHKVYRNAKQCREHWTCYLSPLLKKGPWQLHEDVRLLKFIKDNKGLKKWSQIARNFQGRTENALKNRYTLIIEKQKKAPRNKSKPQLDLISEYLEKCYVDQFTTNVKSQQEEKQQSVYQQQSEPKEEKRHQLLRTTEKKEQIHNCDTNQSVITPVRVQKFNINDFQSMTMNFFRNIQPGVIESDGTFKKINSVLIKDPSSSSQKQPQSADRKASMQTQLAQLPKPPFKTSFP